MIRVCLKVGLSTRLKIAENLRSECSIDKNLVKHLQYKIADDIRKVLVFEKEGLYFV